MRFTTPSVELRGLNYCQLTEFRLKFSWRIATVWNLRFKGSYNFAIEDTSDVCVALLSCHNSKF